jgi:hypothetical protein
MAATYILGPFRLDAETDTLFRGGEPDESDQPAPFAHRFDELPSGSGAKQIDSAARRLDQAAVSNVNISGAGKISVDVKAPPGTTVGATAEGFFKSTEVTRMTQMFPADIGPLPMTGIGAGQGVSGNGTSTA